MSTDPPYLPPPPGTTAVCIVRVEQQLTTRPLLTLTLLPDVAQRTSATSRHPRDRAALLRDVHDFLTAAGVRDEPSPAPNP